VGAALLIWWTRSQRIRSAGELAFACLLLETTPRPAYQRIAAEAGRLRTLELPISKIAVALGVADKTVAKTLAWRDAGVE